MTPTSSAEIIIIGGGLYGGSIAYNLAQQGAREVLVLERGRLGTGSTATVAPVRCLLEPA